VEYANRQDALDVFGYCILPARGAAACLNVNCLLILLPICRHLTTWVQCTPLHSYFPFNAYLESHILFGMAILFWACVHVGAHVCDFYRFAYADEDAIYVLFGDKLGVVPPEPTARIKLLLKQPAAITGIIMVVCILIAYPVVLVRRTKFNTFWILHHLLLVMLVALCCHGIASLLEPYASVYYVIGPLVIYVLSRVLRETKLSNSNVLLAQTKSGGIVHLQLKKPLGWKHVRSGMYAFLNVPQISRIEWHPFTLTSTPDDPFVEFHFASIGDWTDAVQSYLLEQIQAAKHENGGEDGNGGGGAAGTAISLESVQFKVDGPMGASSQGFMDFEVVVLVGAGAAFLA
jgi:FAD-binding domain/Ferric reductase like transmembrane component